MHPNRLRWGALAWLLTLQFFVAETIAQLAFEGPYSRLGDVISDLGTADSRLALLMNASFVLQAALILAGVFLLRPLLAGASGTAAVVLLEVAAVGALLVGLVPADGNGALHDVGAILYLVAGGLGLVALAYSMRPRSEALGTTLAALGVLGTAATVFFLTAVTGYLGEGGTERVAAYVLPIGLAVAGAGLWRLAPRPGAAEDRQQARQRARAERAARERQRDEALADHARRTEGAGDGRAEGSGDGRPGGENAGEQDLQEMWRRGTDPERG